jgi:hypothetical protein
VTAIFYASITSATSTLGDMSNSGTTSTATDIIEIRMGNGTYAPSRREVYEFVLNLERWLVQGGLDQLGAFVPVPPDQLQP